MVDAMHVWRDDDPSEDTIHWARYIDVRMVEKCGCVQNDLEKQHSNSRRPQGCYNCQFDAHGGKDFDWMEAQSRGCVKIEVRVMHPVQSPKPRYRMEHHMLKVNCEI